MFEVKSEHNCWGYFTGNNYKKPQGVTWPWTLQWSIIIHASCNSKTLESDYQNPFILYGYKTGKMFLNKPPIISEHHNVTLKHFFLKQTKLSRSTFSQLIYMPFRLCFMNPIYHVFFHHKMLGDYAECHPNRVVWIAANLWKCSAAGERKRKKHAHIQLGKSRERTLLNLY